MLSCFEVICVFGCTIICVFGCKYFKCWAVLRVVTGCLLGTLCQWQSLARADIINTIFPPIGSITISDKINTIFPPIGSITISDKIYLIFPPICSITISTISLFEKGNVFALSFVRLNEMERMISIFLVQETIIDIINYTFDIFLKYK